MTQDEAANLFAVLANADRLGVIRALVEAGPEGMSAGEIARRIGASPSRCSFHLAGLSEAGFTTRERRSRSLTYRVNFARLGALVQFLLEDCCKGSADLRRCCAPSSR